MHSLNVARLFLSRLAISQILRTASISFFANILLMLTARKSAYLRKG